MIADRVAVIGLGLIGGSMAAAFRRHGSVVVGFDASPRRADLAVRLGLIDEAAGSPATAVSAASVVVIAAPVLAIVDLLPMVDSQARTAQLVLDTGSVKSIIVRAMERLSCASVCVGGHPVAGKERSGPEHADPDIFQGRTFILTPTAVTSAEALDRATLLARSLGSRVLVTDAGKHDRVVATTSHLPQLVSTALAGQLDPSMIDFAGPGIRDMTRLAASDPRMWEEILLSNRDNVVSAARRYISSLGHLIDLVEAENATGVLAAMESAGATSNAVREAVPA